MKPKQIWANLAVKDLDRTTKFYLDLGFRSNGQSEDLTSIIFGDNNFIINFFTHEHLQKFIPELADLSKGNEIMFSISAQTKEEVDQWAEKVRSAGGKIFIGPTDYEQGYTFGFSDPDGHMFNVLYWPGM